MSTDMPMSYAHQPRPRNSDADLRKQGEPRPRSRPRFNQDPRSGSWTAEMSRLGESNPRPTHYE